VAKRLRGFSVLEFILIVVIAAAAVSPIFLIPGRDNFVRHNTRDTSELLRISSRRIQPAHRDALEGHLLAQVAIQYQHWKSRTEGRIKDLTDRKYKQDAPAAEGDEKKARSVRNFDRAQPREKLELVRAVLYLHFALTGVRPLDEVKKEKNGVAELVNASGGSELTDPFYDPKQPNKRLQWNPATGDPPGLEFTQQAIDAYVQTVDRSMLDLVDSLYAEPAPKSKAGKYGGPHAKHRKDIEEYREAVKGMKENYRHGWMGLLAYTTKRIVEAGEAKGPVAALEALRKDLKATHDRLSEFCKENGSQIDSVSARTRFDDKSADLDIKLCRIEVEVADLLTRMSAEIRAVLAAQVDAHYRTAFRKIIIGEGPGGVGDVIIDPKNKQQYSGTKGLFHVRKLKGYSELTDEEKRQERPPLPETPAYDKALAEIAPFEPLFGRFPGGDPERGKLRDQWSTEVTAIQKVRRENAELLVLRAGVPAALNYMTAADLAGRRALDRTFNFEFARMEFYRLLQAVEPRRDYFLELVAQWERARKALEPGDTPDKAGGIAGSLDRLKHTLEKGELDAKGAVMKGKDGQPRPGLQTQLDNARKREAEIKQTLLALYNRSEQLDQIPRNEFAGVEKQADYVRSLVEKLLKGQGTFKDRAGDFEQLLGPIREGNRGGELGKGMAMLKAYNETATKVWPYWWDYYTKYVDVKAKEAAGDEELILNREKNKGKPPPDVNWDGDAEALIGALHARDVIGQNAEFRGVDAAKAAKIADLPAEQRNRVLAGADAINFAAFLEKLDAAKRDTVIKEADYYGVEKLIAHYESMLSWPVRKEGGPKMLTLAERTAALDGMVYPEVPVLTAKVNAAMQLMEGAPAAEGRAEVIGLNKQKADQDKIIADASALLGPAAEAVRKAALEAAVVSASMIREEAEVAALFEDALQRWYPAAEAAAERTNSGWVQTLARVNRGTFQLQAAAFYLEQHRRLAALHNLIERLKATNVPPVMGVDPLWSDAANTGKTELDNAINHVGMVRALMNAQSDPKVDAAAFEVAGGEKKATQPIPLVRVVGWDETLPSGRAVAPSLVAEGIRSLWSAHMAWRAEQEPRFYKDFVPESTSLAKEAEYFRIRKEYRDLQSWPIIGALGQGYAMGYRCAADKSLQRYGPTALKESELTGLVPADPALRPAGVASSDRIAEHLLQWAYSDGLTKVHPSLRLGGLSSLDPADPDYQGDRARAGGFILERLGYTRTVKRFQAETAGR
jgi:hypothetical protein